jgi:hypothetical protein
MAERVDEAALPVDAPRHLMITDLVDAAIGSGCYGALDEAVRVIDEHFDADRARAKCGGGVPAVVLGFTEKECGAGNVQPAGSMRRV